jgi:hypothetical protein
MGQAKMSFIEIGKGAIMGRDAGGNNDDLFFISPPSVPYRSGTKCLQ